MKTQSRLLIWMVPDIIYPNALLNQVYWARAVFIFKGTLCSQFLLRRFYLSSCTGIFNIWLSLPVLHSWMYDRLSEPDITPALPYCVFVELWERVLFITLKMQETIKDYYS